MAVPIGRLKPYAKNPRKNDAAVDAVANSIEAFGFRQPIVVDADMVVIVGHTRLKAAKKLGMTEVPVVVADMPEDEAKAYRIADNRTQDIAEWDVDLLKSEAEALKDVDYDMSLLGFTDSEVRELLGSAGLTDGEDDVPEVPEEAVSEPGNIWLLGDHRLICGDSLDAGNQQKLFGDKVAHMVFTDPPYNVDYGSSKNPRHKIRSIENDSMSSSEWVSFCKGIVAAIHKYCAGDVYVWGASGPEGMRQRLMLHDSGIHWSATIVWKKQQLILSPAKYQRMYEPCFYGWVNKSSFVADRRKTEVWEFDRPLNSKLHPTMKPVELCEYGILNSSNKGDIVLDLFLGSGSTLIACEKAGRTCYGAELDPRYCDVIVKRWEDFTGKKATLEASNG